MTQASQGVENTFHVKKISYLRLAVELFLVVFVIIHAVIKKNLARIIPALRRPKLNFRDKVVLLTGAGGGFGRRLAERLAERGAIIACVDVDNRANQRCVVAANQAAAAAGRGSKPAAFAFRANLVNREETQRTVKEVERKFGRIDILISGAVSFTSYDVMGYDDDEIDFLIDLNFKSTIWLIRAVLPGMKERGFGQIAAFSSVAALSPPAGASMYAGCKSALQGYMNSLYDELRKEPADVGVTILYPFFSPTSPIIREATTSRIPNLDPDIGADQIVEAIEAREVNVVLPRYMSGLAGIHGIFPQEAVDYITDVAGVKIYKVVQPKATITVDKWVGLDLPVGPTGVLLVPHDGDEVAALQKNREDSVKSF